MTEFSPPYSVTPSGFKIPPHLQAGVSLRSTACLYSVAPSALVPRFPRFSPPVRGRRVPTLQKGGRPRAGGRGMHRGRPGEGGGGAGGSRTHVRTRKPHAFYTLIPDFIFERRQDLDHQPAPYPLRFHHDGEAHPDYFRFSCAAGSSDSEQHPWGDVSFPHLVKDLS